MVFQSYALMMHAMLLKPWPTQAWCPSAPTETNKSWLEQIHSSGITTAAIIERFPTREPLVLPVHSA